MMKVGFTLTKWNINSSDTVKIRSLACFTLTKWNINNLTIKLSIMYVTVLH